MAYILLPCVQALPEIPEPDVYKRQQALDVSPHALDVPDIDSYIGLMHTLFTLEDLYGLTVSESDGEIRCV